MDERRLDGADVETARGRQHQAVAELGRLALGGLTGEALFARAVEMVGLALDVPWVEVAGPGVHAEHGARPDGGAAVTVPVELPEAGGVLAMLSACATPGLALGADHVSFLESVANVLAATIGRDRREAALLASRARLRAVLDNTAAVIYIKDPDLRYRLVNRRFRELFGEQWPEEGGFTDFDVLDPVSAEAIAANDRRVLETGEAIEVEQVVPGPDGDHHYVSLMFPLREGGEEGGEVSGVGGIVVDVTERRRAEAERDLLEARMHAAQRLESIGQLAGGIAHDFNNLLAVIRNYAGFVVAELPEGSQAREDISQIQRATERATALTQQLLIFSRRDLARPEVLDLNAAVTQTEQLLRRTLGAQVELRTELGEGVPPVEIDPGLVEHVLINLAINARDAMPGGGALCIRTCASADGAVVEVSDTGVGMAPEVAARAVEPFFTTKPTGEGTGLGLSTAHGVVTRAGGTLELRSVEDEGTTVRIALPASGAALVPAVATDGPDGAPASGGGRRVLVVEDEDALRELVERILEQHGYSVVVAPDGASALEAFAAVGPVDLLLTDLVMPGLSGSELAEELRRRDPELPVVFMSGYTDDPRMRGQGVLAKPFDAQELLRRVAGAFEV